METLLKTLGEMPIALTKEVKNRVKRVKLKTNPTTTPIGRLLPPPIEPDKTIGKTGRMQGESIVTIPAKKENPNRMSIP